MTIQAKPWIEDEPMSRIKLFFWRLWALFTATRIARTYEGPAKLELFGHQREIGWCRENADTIEMLTTDGKVVWFDVRSRYRLTPLTLQELVDECLSLKSTRDASAKSRRSERNGLLEDLNNRSERIANLRHGLKLVLIQFVDEDHPIKTVVGRVLDEDNEQALKDEPPIPF